MLLIREGLVWPSSEHLRSRTADSVERRDGRAIVELVRRHCSWQTGGMFDEPDRSAGGWRRPSPNLRHQGCPHRRQPRSAEQGDRLRLAHMRTLLTQQAPRRPQLRPGISSLRLHGYANRVARATARRDCEPIVEGDTERHVDWITGVEKAADVAVVQRLDPNDVRSWREARDLEIAVPRESKSGDQVPRFGVECNDMCAGTPTPLRVTRPRTTPVSLSKSPPGTDPRRPQCHQAAAPDRELRLVRTRSETSRRRKPAPGGRRLDLPLSRRAPNDPVRESDRSHARQRIQGRSEADPRLRTSTTGMRVEENVGLDDFTGYHVDDEPGGAEHAIHAGVVLKADH